MRKSLHLLLFAIPASYLLLGELSLKIFAAIALVVPSLDYLRRKSASLNKTFVTILGAVLRQHELDGKKLCGASWVALSAFFTFYTFKAEIAVTAFTVLVISDTCAALIGKSFASEKFFEKSVVGSSAFFVSALLVVFCSGVYFDAKFSFYIFGLIAAAFTTIIEARPSLFNVDDNFTIPVSFALVASFLDLVWHYDIL